jgi:hypothetical protein
MAEKINVKMNMMEMAMTMSEGNPGALSVIMEMMQDPTGLLDILMLDSMDIRGSHLYMLNNDCCRRDPAKFKRTLMMLRSGVFTQEQIHENLGRCRALPFIDDSIEMEGVPSYDDDFGPTHPKWDEWCEAQKESFQRRTA